MGCRCPAEQVNRLENAKEKDLSKSSSLLKTPLIDTASPLKPLFPKPESGCFSNENTKTTNLTKELKQYCEPPLNPTPVTHSSLCSSLFNEINQIRTNPRSYLTTIAKYLPLITTKDEKFLLNVGNDVFIALNTGQIAFQEAIAYLSTLVPMPPLKMEKELEINIEDETEECTSLEYIKSVFTKKSESLKGSFDIVGFHYDKSVDNAEVSAVLQIVDDTGANNVRRNNILNRKAEYVGISVCFVKENEYCFYLVFGNKK